MRTRREEVPMAETKQKKRPNADLVQAVRNHKDRILKVYDQLAEKRPLIVLDFQHQKIHARPYEEYKAMLREDSQGLLNEEYVKAVAKNKVLVLVWDEKTGRLVTTKFRRNGSPGPAATS
jgi:hypothetical protein